MILVAQEVTLYGVDLYGEKSLPLLLNELNDIEGLQWIRLLYCYPEEIDDALIHAIASLPKRFQIFTAVFALTEYAAR